MAAPTWQATGTLASGTGNVTVNWPTHLTNDIGLLCVESANQTIALTTANGFVEVPDSPQGSGTAGGSQSSRLAVFWCRATSGSMASPVITDPGDHAVAYIVTFRGCKTSGNPWNVTAGDTETAATTSVTIPGDTTTVADCLVVAIASNRADVDTGRATGWTNASLTSITERADLYTSTPGNGGGVSLACGVMASAGTYNATTCTFSTSSVQGRISLALEPATTAHVVVAESGSYGVTGTAADLEFGRVVAAGAGSYALTGTDASLERGFAVIADAGAYSLTGTAANLVYTPASNKLLAADTGSYSLTGTAASLEFGFVVGAGAGSYTITGSTVNLIDNRKIIADTGSYALTGTAANLFHGRKVAADAGVYAFTGQDAQLVYEQSNAYVVGAAAGDYVLTGSAASLFHGRKLSVDAGAFSITGTSAEFSLARPSPIPVHFAIVAIPSPNRGTVSVPRRNGTSVMDTYVTSDITHRTSNDHLRTSDAPMRYV